jgi:biopolymer transport protein ExbB
MKNKSSLLNLLGILVMLGSVIVAYFIYNMVLGNPNNFVGGDPNNDALEGNFLGIVHKGGKIVILQIAFMIILLTYIVERGIALYFARGKEPNKRFAKRVELAIAESDFDKVETLCDAQKGSIGNVVKKGIQSYKLSSSKEELRPEEKAYQIKKELEEATLLEVPTLEKNMVIISTLASIATLVGLLGTVTGMIKAFAALARSGTPDAVGLAGGISQALVTTALGITTAAFAIVFYNFYTNLIDKITYSIDQSNYTILNHFKVGEKAKMKAQNAKD